MLRREHPRGRATLFFDVPPDGFVSNVNDGGLLTIPGIASGTWNVTLTNALEFQP